MLRASCISCLDQCESMIDGVMSQTPTCRLFLQLPTRQQTALKCLPYGHLELLGLELVCGIHDGPRRGRHCDAVTPHGRNRGIIRRRVNDDPGQTGVARGGAVTPVRARRRVWCR